MKYYIIKGSDKYFEEFIKKNNFEEQLNFINIIHHNDACTRGERKDRHDNIDTLIIRSQDLFSITLEANMRLYDMTKEICNDEANIIIQNPSDHTEKKIKNNSKNSYKECMEDLSQSINYDAMKNKYMELNEKEIAKTLLMNKKYEKQIVIFLYGNTGLGKTQLVKNFAEKYSNKNDILRVQLSNYQNQENLNELYGEGPLSNDLIYKLQHRTSNIILFDEFDKMHPIGQNAFFELFDEEIFRNRYRSISTKNLIIFCTSNYQSIKEIKKNLSLPIYSRINKFIKFDSLSEKQIEHFIKLQIENFLNDFKINKYDYNQIEQMVLGKLSELDHEPNYRNLKRKCNELFEEIYFEELLEE